VKPRICLVGQVVVDVLHLDNGPIVRLGGVFHAARALSALKCDFEIAYVAPKYLDHEIISYGKQLGAANVNKLGEVDGCPNVLFVGEPREAGSQDYEFILDQHQRCQMNLQEFKKGLSEKLFTDVLIFPGGFELATILASFKPLKASIHVDANFGPTNFRAFRALGRQLDTLILSTSSFTFLNIFKGNYRHLCKDSLKVARSFLFKENRGGSRYFQRGKANPISIPAFPRNIIHSVGVGDCFNAALVCLCHKMPLKPSLIYASLLAGEYASVLTQSHFANAVNRTMKIKPSEAMQLHGVLLPWELRQKVNIYIAAPDFKSANRSEIERVVSCLKYHNFVPRRPVIENGEINSGSGKHERIATAAADIQLLNNCQILLAILIFDDPGTYIEIGVAHQMGLPVIIYAPNHITDNLLTNELPILVSPDIDAIVSEVFRQAATFHAK
jgi:nucleoside 2-deoxyribosyltransferase